MTGISQWIACELSSWLGCRIKTRGLAGPEDDEIASGGIQCLTYQIFHHSDDGHPSDC